MNTKASTEGDAARRADVLAFISLLAVIVVAVSFRFHYDNWLSGFDMFTYFLPNYEYIGQRLRDFDIPAWNPHFNSGTPSAGDPGAGWLYAPVMIGMFLFKAGSGIKAMVMIQALVAGSATYVLARRIGLIPIAAFFSAITFAIGAPLYDATGQSTVIGQVSTFVPLGMLAAENALRAQLRSSRFGWSCLGGIAISQMFLAWPQGFLYGTMMTAGWMAYRTLIDTAMVEPGLKQRLLQAIESGIVIGLAAALSGAAGILPRLDFSRNSNIPGGDYSDVIGGNYVEWTAPWTDIIGHYLEDTVYWRITVHSSAVLLLGIVAVMFGRRRHGIPFFAIVAFVSVDLAANFSLTRWFFYIFPPFELIHHHRPTATMYMVFLPFAMLAGSGLQLVLDTVRFHWRSRRHWLPSIALAAVMLVEQIAGYPIGFVQPAIAIVATLLMFSFHNRWPHGLRHIRPISRRALAVSLIGLTLWFPTGADLLGTVFQPANYPDYDDLLGKDKETQGIIEEFTAESGSDSGAAFMQEQQETQPPFRYAWYLGMGFNGSYINSSGLRTEPGTIAALANGRSVFLGLEEIAGYNPIHLKYYVDYSNVMNGTDQNYHWLDTYERAFTSSQLLDMLNVRFILVDATLPGDRADVLAIASVLDEVYRDDLVVIYENPRALPRAWIVHDVLEDTGDDALLRLDSYAINGQSTALVAGTIPPVSSGDDTIEDSVEITSRTPESMQLRVTSDGDGLLTISEIYEHNWSAWVDGKKVEIVRTNHTMRGIPVSSGEHTVVMKYESTLLSVGVWTTVFGGVAIVGIWIWALVDRKRGRGPATSTPG